MAKQTKTSKKAKSKSKKKIIIVISIALVLLLLASPFIVLNECVSPCSHPIQNSFNSENHKPTPNNSNPEMHHSDLKSEFLMDIPNNIENNPICIASCSKITLFHLIILPFQILVSLFH